MVIKLPNAEMEVKIKNIIDLIFLSVLQKYILLFFVFILQWI